MSADTDLRALDERVASLLFGWAPRRCPASMESHERWFGTLWRQIASSSGTVERCPYCAFTCTIGTRPPNHDLVAPPFSSGIAAAFEVVEKMRERGYPWFTMETDPGKEESWCVEFRDRWIGPTSVYPLPKPRKGYAWGSTESEAIVRAALVTLDQEDGSPITASYEPDMTTPFVRTKEHP